MVIAILDSCQAVSDRELRSPVLWHPILLFCYWTKPLGALDAKLRGQVQRELKSIQRQTNKTFFFVTHDQEEALTMSDRIVVMNHGRG